MKATTAFPGMVQNGNQRLDAWMMIPDQLEMVDADEAVTCNRGHAETSDKYCYYYYACEDALL